MKTLLSTFLIAALFFAMLHSCTNKPAQETTAVASNVEDSIRTQLNIPAAAQHVLILSPAAHMDWDWLNPFPYNVNLTPPMETYGYFDLANNNNAPANQLLTKAAQNLNNPGYYYSVCEMGFLRAFAEDSTAFFNQMKASNRMRVVGGGITSPDNLLPNGEAFFRNYLVANQWMDSVQIPWSQQVWIPDDFGHDPQLPVMLNAMDAMGVGFARIPGACDQQSRPITAGKDELMDPTTGGVDFVWQAHDGSSVIAHWMEDHYSQGADIDKTGSDKASPKDIMDCSSGNNASTAHEHISNYIGANKPVSPTPYIYVQVSNDFMYPDQDLVADANDWNSSTTYGYSQTGVYVVVATFDEYVRLVDSHKSSLYTRSYNPASGTNESFTPNPYWMGFYASRPELKILHNKATRSLLAAESYQVLANSLLPSSAANKQQQLGALYKGWNTLAPSTHHDYITGTAVDGVYKEEQLPMLKAALKQGDSLRDNFMNSLAAALPAASNQVVVFNQLGMANSGVIPYNSGYINVSAPSLGYQTSDLATASQGDGSLQYSQLSNGTYQLENSLLQATFDPNSGDLTSVIDKATGNNILSGTGNNIEFYNDSGDIYRFGYEGTCVNFGKDNSVNATTISVTPDVSNALNKGIQVKRNYTANGQNFLYTITYNLRQGEPMLRIETEGAAPADYSVMVSFPLSDNIASMEVGTPYHWNTVYPIPYGASNSNPFNSTMWATHDFVIPKGSSGPLAAIYHAATPAWTSGGNTLYGVILRNNPSPNTSCVGAYGADGSDYDSHSQSYALRIPSGISGAETAMPLKEARKYNTPMQAVAVPSSGGGSLPTSYSVASASGNALITCAKWNSTNGEDLILRVYQSSNASYTETINVAAPFVGCSAVSALEKDFVNAQNAPACTTGSSTNLTVNMPTAVATVKLTYQ